MLSGVKHLDALYGPPGEIVRSAHDDSELAGSVADGLLSRARAA